MTGVQTCALPISVYTNTLMMELGEELYFSCGSNKNIKITTLEDVDIFKALYATKRDTWLNRKNSGCMDSAGIESIGKPHHVR